MAYVNYNPNPLGKNTGDCVVRALTMALPSSWQGAYVKLAVCGLDMADMPTSNSVWGAFLKKHGFERHTLPNDCPDCYAVREFAADHPTGVYVLATGTHAICVKDGDYYDSWDSGDEIPMYYFEKEIDNG